MPQVRKSKIMWGLVFGLVAFVLLALAQPPVKLVDGQGNEVSMAAAGKRYESEMTTIGSSLTTITSVTTKVQGIWCTVPATDTLGLVDGAGVTYLPSTTSITGPGALLVINTPVGFTWTSGVKAISGSGNIQCKVVGVQ